jgi:membrane-bound lytic murein transglycosylase D
VLLLALTACAGVPERGGPSPAEVSIPAPDAAATPTIPPPVPVDVAGLPPAAQLPGNPPDVHVTSITTESGAPADGQPVATEGQAADGTAPATEPAETLPPPDLLDRVRRGLALGKHYNSRIDKEADYFANNPEYVERVFSRAAPYMYYIVGEVEARGLPLELALLPIIESAFQPYAYSRARASGLWQFMAATGSRFQLKQDWWYDGRRDVVAATGAALDYLTYLYDMFDGNWLHAIAAYNCGEGNVRKAIRRNKAARKPTDFWNLKLPAETKGYVPRLLAMTRIVAEPESYGLAIEGIPDTAYFVKAETGGQISMEVAAELAGVTTEQMYDLNPAYHRWATDPTGPHLLLVPVEAADAFRQSLLLLTPDQRLRVERYEVKAGDTVTNIAARFGTTAQHLREMNELGNANTIALGAELRVPSAVKSLPEQVRLAAARVDARTPAGVRAVHVVRRGDTLSAIAKRHGIGASSLARINGISTSSTLRVGQRLKLSALVPVSSTGSATAGAVTGTQASGDGHKVTYVVRRGDTLSSIARSLQVSINALREWNNISGSSIRAGQKLVAYVRRGT